ncbi:MAG: insulinase family protein, partial [Acidobacteria bacterium]
MSTRNLLVAFLLCFVWGSSQAADKELPPEGGKPRDFRLPEKSVIKLDNGLSATLVPYGVLPKVTVAIVVRAGNINESA